VGMLGFAGKQLLAAQLRMKNPGIESDAGVE
jgi:hypothetical protein